MSIGRKRILSPLTWPEKQKSWNKTREKYMPEERRQIYPKQTRDQITKQKEWLESFLR